MNCMSERGAGRGVLTARASPDRPGAKIRRWAARWGWALVWALDRGRPA
jgi:hypothetical protein